MKTFHYITKSVLLFAALLGFFASANGAWAQEAAAGAAAANENASNIYGDKDLTSAAGYTGSAGSVLAQIYNLIRFAYTFFYAIAVLLVAQAWLQFKQQKYDIMFASMGAALGLFLTPAIIDFLHSLGQKTGTSS
jgi:hypothetical protein